ncbi:nucleotide-binding universal stress UspA family protein [Solirubrobacter pauli]|uniref:Nucleotide-binding universal stress UspA family protein n=1 Tax=Solirubrobacter pauli TaxID=166793 RepID=A0A660LGA3_9ACTN|nr:nucleotide-binding universal stress UspA family protein [Solirubrobacter pauli]
MSTSASHPSAVAAVCAVDEDAYAADVVVLGTWLASKLELEPRFVHVAPAQPRPDAADLHLLNAARAAASALFEDLRLPSGRTEMVVAESAAAGILGAAREHGAQLVIMGSRGQGAVTSAALGSTTRAVIAEREVPVVVVRAGAAPVTLGGPLVCAVVDDGADQIALAQAVGRMAARLGAALVLVHAVELGSVRTGSPRMPGPRVDTDRGAAERLMRQVLSKLPPGLDVDARVRPGRPAPVIADVADEVSSDLVIVGHRARGAVATAVTGSTALELIGMGTRPTMLLPPRLADGFLPLRR